MGPTMGDYTPPVSPSISAPMSPDCNHFNDLARRPSQTARRHRTIRLSNVPSFATLGGYGSECLFTRFRGGLVTKKFYGTSKYSVDTLRRCGMVCVRRWWRMKES